MKRLEMVLVAAMLFCVAAQPPCRAQELSVGDLNQDQLITSVDAALVLQILAGIHPADPAADADGDGQTTLVDARMILTWASQNYGLSLPETFTEPFAPPTLESAGTEIGPQGGNVALASGVTVSIPAGQLETAHPFTLEKKDLSGFDGTGARTGYQISPDPTLLPGATIAIPYADIGQGGAAPEAIGAVILDVYDPWTRTYRMIPVDYTAGAEALIVALDQVREAASLAPATRMPAATGRSGISDLISDTVCSVWIIIKETWYIQSQSTREILPVPFYDQGDTPHCWAVATSMAVRYCQEDDFVKPWDLVAAMKLPDGFQGAAAYKSARYASFIETRTGAKLERGAWTKGLNQSLRLYLKKQILDEKRPVILFLNEGNILSAKAHAVLVVGYEVKNGEGYLYLHNPQQADLMYQLRSWKDIADQWVNTAVYYTFVIPAAPAALKPITVYTLSRNDAGSTLAFVSPMEADPNAITSGFRVNFNWYDEAAKGHDFISHNGEGLRIDPIPAYYGMDLRLNLGNASAAAENVKVDWSLRKIGGGGMSFSGESAFTVPAKTVLTGAAVHFFHPGFDGASGEYGLDVEVYETETFKTCDAFFLPLRFGDGLPLQARRRTDAGGNTAVELKWDALSGFDGDYQAFKKNAAAPSWTSLGMIAAPGPYEKTDPNYLETDDPSYAVAGRKDRKLFITSDLHTFRKLQGNLSFNYADPQTLQTGIGFAYLPTGETWRWDPSPDHGLLLLGMTPSGVVAAFDSDNAGDHDRLLLRDNWGVGQALDVTAPCGLSALSDPDAGEAGLTDAATVYFTGVREVHEGEDYWGNPIIRQRHFVFASDGDTCSQAPVDVNRDGTVDTADHIDGLGIEELVVARVGNTLLLWGDDPFAMHRMDLANGDFDQISADSSGAMRISRDGSRCLFSWDDGQREMEEAAVMPTGGGAPVRLSQATGVQWTPHLSDISSDGAMVCGYVVEILNQNPIEVGRVGLAVADADGSGFRWLDTGTVVLAEGPRFSADDQSIVFAGINTLNPDEVQKGITDIYMMRVDGTEPPQNLTHTPTIIEANPYIE